MRKGAYYSVSEVGKKLSILAKKKKTDFCLHHIQKLNCGLVKYLNFKNKVLTFFVENTGVCLLSLGIGKDFENKTKNW